MKNFNTNHDGGSPAFGKYRRMPVFLTLFLLFFTSGLKAQGPCSGITFSFEQYEDCKFRARYNSTSECFIEIRYILESGTFSSFVVNSAAGFTVQEISSSELWVHHNQGFVPLGNQVPLLFTLPHDLNTTMNIAYLDDCAMVGCEIFGGIPIESCPDLQDASIIGVKYRECGSLPYGNQPVLSGWTIQLLDVDGNVLNEQLTDAGGAYGFYDLPAGIYVVKETQQPGWMPKVPANGQYSVDLIPSQQAVRNFGNCQLTGTVSGVVYATCDSMPYTNQSVLSGWMVQAINIQGNIVAEDTTDSNGVYFIDLPPGNYWVKVSAQPGTQPSIPASGQALINVIQSSQIIQNFGVCSSCCYTTQTSLIQTQFNQGNCCYSFSYNSTSPPCIQFFEIINPFIDPNSIVVMPGWTYTHIGPQILLYPPSSGGGVIPSGNLTPMTFCVNGTGVQGFTVAACFIVQQKTGCTRYFTFNCDGSSGGACACANGGAPGTQNLIQNSDFDLNAAFTSNYISNTASSLIEGQYVITLLSSLANAGFQPCKDHTTGNGNMMVVNGSTLPNQKVWCQTVAVAPNTDYLFSGWAQSLVSAAPALLELNIDDTAQGNPFQLPTTTCDWQQFCVSWKSGNSPTAKICVYNLNTSASGNDFALDDFSFRECKPPVPCAVTISANPTPFCGTGTLTANPTGLAPFSYQWSHGQNTQTINVQGLPCGSVCSVSVTCADGSMSSASYTVSDNVPPVAVCNLGIGIDLGAACTFQVTPAFVDGGSTDNCGIQSMSVSPATLAACTNTIVTLTVTDWCGNTSTCTMGIQTTEGMPPIMTCPANTTINGTVGPTGPCTATFSPVPPVAIDNCDPSVTVTNNAPPVLQQGPNTITWTATDDCGNQTTCTQIVTVQCGCDCDGNLVTNGSFENGTAGFPNALDQINQCSGWYAATNNPAANNIGDWYWNPSFPGYYLGPGQTALPAHCGEKYAGFFLNTCEGITTQLSQTITQGCSYEVGFWWTPAVTPTTSFSFYAVMSGGNCTMYHPSGSCSHQCNGDQHVIVNVTPNHFAGTWYHHTMTVTNAYPNVGYMTFTAAQGAPNVNNYIFVDDVCVKKIAEPCSVTASIICYPENPIAYTAQASLGCGSVVTQVDWYFDGNGPNSSCCLNSILHPFTTVGFHTVCLVVTASNDGGHTICKDTMCKEVFIDHVPPTKCEKVLVNWQKLHTVDFLCCYALQLDNLEPDCFTQIDLTLNSGTFANASITLGWTVIGNLNSNQISLVPTASGFLPSGYFSPLTLCNPGGTGPYNLTVTLLYGLPPSVEKCEKDFPFDCPDTPIDSCCLDYDVFCQNVMNAVSVTVDNANCKATLNIGTLPDCDYIEKIIWGDGTQTMGNFSSGSMPMHTYAQSGTYVIQYLAIEVNPHTGLICFEKFLTETIVVVCNECCKDEQAFQAAASAVQISSVYGNCTISVNATNMNDCLRITWNWGDGSPTEGPYLDNTPLTHTYSTYGLFVVSCTITEVDQFGNPCYTIAFSLPQRVECYVLCPDCEHNLVKNPGFFEGAIDGELGGTGFSNNWQSANNTPDVSAGIFCCDAYGIQMWGSQDKGEAICQTGFNFLPTKTYSISFSAYYDQPSSVSPYVQFGFYASNACVNPFPNCTGCETMGVSVQITDQNCATYTLPNWTPTLGYNTLIIKALTANPWPNIGFGRIDNICIQEVTKCVCGSFSEVYARPTAGAQSIHLFCGDTYNFGCPAPGQSIPITGKFECQGDNCPAISQINWSLTQPSGNVINGTVQSNPYFFLPIMPLNYAQPGTYTLVLKGNCGGTDCPPCVIHFTVDCPNPCPCDVPQFQKDVNQGFATALWATTCKGCFSPIALNDCDMVEWKINGGPTIGMTNGNQSFCHTFPGAGTYTVTMIVSRKKSDGSPCETFIFSKTVNVTCIAIPVCSSSVFKNADFDEGAVIGSLGSGTGMSTGWKTVWGDPHVDQKDGRWIISLTGHADSADVLSTLESKCLDKGSGTITLEARITESIGPRDRRLAIFFNRGDSYVFNVFNSENCYRIADLDVTAYDSSWFDLEIPYNLSTWAALDSCGDVPHGVFVKPILYPHTCFEIGQGIETGNTMEIDYLCFEHTLVSVNNPPVTGSLRIFPNPNNGIFTIELPQPAKPGTTFRITDLTGRLVQEQKTEPGSAQQIMRAGELPAGLYFLQVVADGKVLAVEKFVKQ